MTGVKKRTGKVVGLPRSHHNHQKLKPRRPKGGLQIFKKKKRSLRPHNDAGTDKRERIGGGGEKKMSGGGGGGGVTPGETHREKGGNMRSG